MPRCAHARLGKTCLSALIMLCALSTLPGSYAAPGETIFSAGPLTVSASAGSRYSKGDSNGKTCVVTTVTVAAPTLHLTTGFVARSDYTNWVVNTAYPTVAQDVAALKAKILPASLCENTDFSDTSCTRSPVALDASVSYIWVAVNSALSGGVTANSVIVTECTTAQVAALGASSSAVGSLTAVVAATVAVVANVMLY